MTSIGPAGALRDQREVALILRVVLDKENTVRYGEVVEPATNRTDRFTGWFGLVRIVHDRLGLRASDAPLPRPPERP